MQQKGPGRHMYHGFESLAGLYDDLWEAKAKRTHTAFVVQTKLNNILNLQVI
jgi:hypothetical protein